MPSQNQAKVERVAHPKQELIGPVFIVLGSRPCSTKERQEGFSSCGVYEVLHISRDRPGRAFRFLLLKLFHWLFLWRLPFCQLVHFWEFLYRHLRTRPIPIASSWTKHFKAPRTFAARGGRRAAKRWLRLLYQSCRRQDGAAGYCICSGDYRCCSPSRLLSALWPLPAAKD